MSSSTYNENEEPKCLYCGEKLESIRDHFHGRIAKICKYTNCGKNWQCFKSRVKNYKESKFAFVRELAMLAEKKVFDDGEPAKSWNEHLMLVRRKKAILPLITHS